MTPDRLSGILQTLTAIEADPDAQLGTAATRRAPSQLIGLTLREFRDMLQMSVADFQDLARQHAPRAPATPRAQLLEWSDAIADCTCWFKGFMAGKGDDADGVMPPQWRTLIEINIAIKACLSDTSDSAGAETPLPF